MARLRVSTFRVSAIAVVALTAQAVPQVRALNEDAIVTTVAAIVDAPETYRDKQVTVTGRFRGRGDTGGGSLLRPLNQGRWDFVLQSPQGAIWVSGLRPRGQGFDLDPVSKVDAGLGRWLQVTGRVQIKTEASQRCRPVTYCTQPWIQASDIELVTSWHETEIVVPRAVGPAPKVVFNDPAVDETNVSRATLVRVQFSEDMDAATFEGRVRISYAPSGTATPSAVIPAFTAVYKDGTKALEVRFAAPLERFRDVKIELLDGIAARDGQKLPPWTFTFTTGPS